MLGFSPIAGTPIGALPEAESEPGPVASVPDAPTIGTAIAGTGAALASFTPGADGGATVTLFTVYASTGQTATGVASPIAIALPAGVAVTLTVRATNEVGEGPASAASNSVTPTAPVAGTSHSLKRSRIGRRNFS